MCRGGVGAATVEYIAANLNSGRETGFGGKLGLGFDFRLGSRLFLTAMADWLFQDARGLDTSNQLATLTVGITYH